MNPTTPTAPTPKDTAHETEQTHTPEEGSTTVEYAIGVVVAATFAGLLLTIVRSDTVRQALENIVQQALTTV